VPDFEIIVGVSLGGPCRMRLRRYPLEKSRSAQNLSLDVEPRSDYVMRREAREGCQHSIPLTRAVS
jgi:alkylated DNA repair dioxygenase AlkB